MRVCEVNLATCRNLTQAKVLDDCEPSAQSVGENWSHTYNNCSCVGWPGWSYVYANGQNVTFLQCANPDGDPLGAWWVTGCAWVGLGCWVPWGRGRQLLQAQALLHPRAALLV